jgi:hypothetical protein
MRVNQQDLLEDDTDVYRDPGEEAVVDHFDDEERLPDWDGRHIRLRLAFPIFRDHRVVHEGEIVTFAAAAVSGMPGRFVGPEGPHVEDLYRCGTYAGTRPARQRAARNVGIATERCVDEPGEDGVQLRSLRPWNGRRLEASLQKHGPKIDPRVAEGLLARTGPEQQRDWPGAQAPGTAPNRRRAAPAPATPAEG